MRKIANHFPLRAICGVQRRLAMLAASSAFAAPIFVAGGDPNADDKNAGTEAKPLKTIQAAVDKAQAGDTIWVNRASTKKELLPKSSGNMETPITLSAWKDDRVRIGSMLHDAPAADQWKPVEKSRSYGVKLPGGQPKDLTVVLDGKPIVTEPKVPAAGRQGQVGHVPRLRPHADAQPGRRGPGRAHDPAFPRHRFCFTSSPSSATGR